jgi:hypothetical protein
MASMEIIKAEYGGQDCTKQISSKVVNGRLLVRADNNICGDPAVGVVKYLKVDAEIDGKTVTEEVREGALLTMPKPKTNRLGIFYSNNINQAIYPAIRASLESIRKAAEGKADILTCMWRHEPHNPFYQCIAWTQTSSHLNQILQVLQLLYTAKQSGNYKYVSFLEHDLVYAEGYFDYPDFDEGVLANMNYIGMNKEGFQPLGQRDRPTSQLTMLFDDAIKHFESLLPNALVTNSGLLEPQLRMNEWNAEHPNIHINHGSHFTSHYSIYRKDNLFTEHAYWGNHSDYLHLFY